MRAASTGSTATTPETAAERIDVRAMPRVLGRLIRLALQDRAACAAAVLCTLAAALLNLGTPMLLGQAIDRTQALLADPASHAQPGGLWGMAALIVGACLLRGVFTGLQGYLGESLAQRVGYDLRLAYFAQLQRLGFAFHDRHHSGDLIARGMLDLEGVRGFLESGLLRALALGLLVGAGAWRLLHVDAMLGLLALSFVPFVVWHAARLGLRLRMSWTRLQHMMSQLSRVMEENLQGVRVVRAFAAQAFELAKFDQISAAALRLSNQRITTRMASLSTMNLAFYSAMGAVLWFGGQGVAEGRLTLGMLTECLTFMAILQQPVRQVNMIVNASARASTSGARLFEVLDSTPGVAEAPHAADLGDAPRILRFESVGFGYPGASRPWALRGISFELHPGRTLGVVGAPGSGKSTLAQLIARFYDATEGRITVGGHDVRDLSLASLRETVAVVQQECFLFDTSIHHNAAYAVPAAAASGVEEAARTAAIHDHIAQLPRQYATGVGERGVALSGGQRQRVALARSLVAEPRILVLDDATSAVDATTEQAIRGGLRTATRDKAVLIISHRIASLMHADEILVLSEGRIVERGHHAQMLARGGAYARLWALQTPRAQTPAPPLTATA